MGLFDKQGKSKEKKCYEEDIPEWVTKLYSDKKSVGIGSKIKNFFSEGNNDKKVKHGDEVPSWVKEKISFKSIPDIRIPDIHLIAKKQEAKNIDPINIDDSKSIKKEEISSNEVPNWVKNKLS